MKKMPWGFNQASQITGRVILKSVNNLLIIVYSFAVLLVLSHFDVASAQNPLTIEFNDTNSNSKTVHVHSGNQSFPDINSTLNHTSTSLSYAVEYYIDGRRRHRFSAPLYQSNTNSYNFDYGTWYINLNTSSNCSSNTNYYCSTIRFASNASTLSTISYGTTVHVRLSIRSTSPSGGWVHLDTYFVRDDITMTWHDHEGSAKNTDNPSGNYGLHRMDLVTYYNNPSELSFEFWIDDGSDAVTKIRLQRRDWTLLALDDNSSLVSLRWPGTEWVHVSDYGVWVVAEQNFCSSSTDGRKCLQAYYARSSEAYNLSGRNVSISFRASKTHGNLTETDVLDFTLIGRTQTSFEPITSMSNTIVTGNQLEFDDITGTAAIFKQ